MAQIKSRRRVQDYGEVFTADREVKAMCDMLPPEMYQPEKTFLEPAVGEGVFLLEILRRKFANCHKREDYSTALASVWGIDIQTDNVQKTIDNILELCREYFNPTKKDVETLTMHIMQGDSVKIMNMIGVVQKGMDTVQ